ncbi:phage portal protein [Bradyrhizobium neotropicale]|uniref:phage portal protein n=1 Tax=Bradyrhizobium neotropicale TaxID=1497615 RepID=UPI001AD6DBA7|nr:phage portal protein [Bradyrhizobium neotropicale]MBO4228437.1 phage portal protein [Bradyrhizobium neotropicale]
MSFLDIFRKKAPERPASDEPVSPIYVMSGQAVRFLSPAAVMSADVAQRKSSQLYRITNFVAASVQSVPWYCEPDPNVIAAERAGASKIKAINDLLKSPNDTFTSQQFQYWLTINLMLYARAHFKVGVGSTGTPNGLYPLAAKYMKGVLNSRGTVETYEYGQGENKATLPTRRTAERRGGNQAYAAEISFPSLSGLVEYNKEPAAIESIAMPIAIINCLMQRALDTASGHPNIKYVICSERTLTRQQKEALVKHLEESGPGEENSGSVLFIYNTDIKVHKLDNELGDIHSKIPLDDMTRQIAGVFGVPIPLLGLGSADAAKYASNYGESRLSFWQDTVVPCYLSPIAAGMTQAICPPGARVTFDLDSIPALWEGRAALGERLTKVNFLLTNEKRAILGFEPTTEIPAIAPAPASSSSDRADNAVDVATGTKSADVLELPTPKLANGRPLQ